MTARGAELSPEAVDEVVLRMQKTLDKINASQASEVKLRASEADLLGQFENARDMMLECLRNQRDRSQLEEIFGGDCLRIARIRAVLDSAMFSEMYAGDQRISMCSAAVRSVEKVLDDLGHGKALKAAQDDSRESLDQLQVKNVLSGMKDVLQEAGYGEATLVEHSFDMVQLDGSVSPKKVNIKSLVRAKQLLARRRASVQAKQAGLHIVPTIPESAPEQTPIADVDLGETPAVRGEEPPCAGNVTASLSFGLPPATKSTAARGEEPPCAGNVKASLSFDVPPATKSTTALGEEPLCGGNVKASLSFGLPPATKSPAFQEAEPPYAADAPHATPAVGNEARTEGDVPDSASFGLPPATKSPAAREEEPPCAGNVTASLSFDVPPATKSTAAQGEEPPCAGNATASLSFGVPPATKSLAAQGKEPPCAAGTPDAAPAYRDEAHTEGDVPDSASFGLPPATKSKQDLEDAEEEDVLLPLVVHAVILESAAMDLDRAGIVEGAIEKYHDCEKDLAAASDAITPKGAYAKDRPDIERHRSQVKTRIHHLKSLAPGSSPTIPLEAQIESAPLSMSTAKAAAATAKAARTGAADAMVSCAALASGTSHLASIRGRVLLGPPAGCCGGAGGAPPPVCDNKHEIRPVATDEDDYECDVCRQKFPADTIMWSCRKCDYDVCMRCASIRSNRGRIIQMMRQSELEPLTLKVFVELDTDRSGVLGLREVHRLVTYLFQRLGVVAPLEGQIDRAINSEVPGATCLDADQCRRVVDAICRDIFGFKSEEARPAAAPRRTSQVVAATPPGVEPQHFARVVQAISSGELKSICIQIFQQLDVLRSGWLEWNSGGIRSFIQGVFQRLGLPPPLEHQMYAMYTRFDADGNWRLDMFECITLIEMLCCELFGVEGNEGRGRLVQSFASGEFMSLATRLFEARDVHKRGFLEWNSGEIRAFILDLFATLSLDVPADHRIFSMYSRFDHERRMLLSRDQCMMMAEYLCRSLYRIAAGDASSSCPAGHVMAFISTPVPLYQCDSCGGRFPAHTGLWECNPCNYHMCVPCSKNLRAREGKF